MANIEQLIAEHHSIQRGTPEHVVIRVIEDRGPHWDDELRRLNFQPLGYSSEEVTELLDALYLAVEATSETDRNALMHALTAAVPADDPQSA